MMTTMNLPIASGVSYIVLCLYVIPLWILASLMSSFSPSFAFSLSCSLACSLPLSLPSSLSRFLLPVSLSLCPIPLLSSHLNLPSPFSLPPPPLSLSFSLRFLADVMEELKRDGVDTKVLWQEITRIVQLTLNAIHPDVALSYSTAFQKSPANHEMMFRNAKRPPRKAAPSSLPTGGEGGVGEQASECLATGSLEWKDAERLQENLFSSKIDGGRCFQMMGFDIFLDKKCKPYIIEINHNPSFKLPTPLDGRSVETPLDAIFKSCSLLNLSSLKILKP